VSYISEFFGSIFNWINTFTNNYGISIVLFTILFRLILLPFDIRSRKGQREYTYKLKKIQPELDMINKAYSKDPQKAQQMAMEIRKREGIGLMPKGCGTMLLTYPILIAFFAVFRNLAAQKMVELSTLTDPNQIQEWFDTNSFLWVKNIWQPDVFFNFKEVYLVRAIPIIKGIDGFILPETATELQAVLQSAFNNGMLNEVGSAYDLSSLQNFSNGVFQGLQNVVGIAGMNNFGIADGVIWSVGNGFYILPILAGAVQLLSFKASSAQQMQGNDPTQQQAQKSGKFMQIFFPILFVYFCLVSSSALAIYWITSSLCMLLVNYIINKVLDARDKKKLEAEGEK
jgi:YidC/Oxa1 family membrane protein insertase